MKDKKITSYRTKQLIVNCLAGLILLVTTNAKADNRYINGYQAYFSENINQLRSDKHQVAKTIQASELNTTQAILSQNKDESITEQNLKTDLQIQQQDSLFITNPNEPPIAWLSMNDNLESAGLHGNLRTQIESDNVRWKHDKERNNGNYKYAIINAFLRHGELPNWYFGFYFAKEENYQGHIFDQSYQDNTNISEIFIGHIFETYRGNIGLEGMFGAESGLNRLKTRVKTWLDYRLTHDWYLNGYAFYEYQPDNNRVGNNDTHNTAFETEPVLKYQFDNHNGIWLSSLYSRNKQARKSFGSIIEDEQNIRLGFFHNWTDLFSSFYIGTGRVKKYNQANSREIFYKNHHKMIGITASYPLINDIRMYGEFKYQRTKEYGLWTKAGHNWNPFTLLGLVYEF